MAQFLPLLESSLRRVVSPVVWALGAPRLVAQLAARLDQPGGVAYQMDLFQAERLRAELASAKVSVDVKVAPDLWDLAPDFRTVIFPSPPRAERELKIDMVEQAFHVLQPQGRIVVLSPHRSDDLFPKLIKKVFGNVSITATSEGTILWGQRVGDRARRRHEICVQARVDDGAPIRFVTRPGVFTYGQMDSGSRALLIAAEIREGDRVMDLGCGAGAVGLAAARRVGPTGHVTFVDSNLRATTLAEFNARQSGLRHFDVVAARRLEGLPGETYDVILTNPPYYAIDSITHLFVERSRELLKPGGRFYLVTKQWESVEPIVRRFYGEPEVFENRGYFILCARKPEASSSTLPISLPS